MTGTGKSYEVKQWFANKVANEIGRNINMCNVFGVLKESEKAVYAILNCGTDCRKTMWVPKSALVEYEVGEDAQGVYHHETKKYESYNEGVDALNAHWSDYR